MRINDTDENRLSQMRARKASFDTHRYLFCPQNAFPIAPTRLDSQTLGPGPAPAATRPKEADYDRPSRWNPRRSEPAVRPRRARRPDTRPDVLELRKDLQARSDSAGVAFDSGGRRAASPATPPAAAAAPVKTAATTGHARPRLLALLFGVAFLLALAYAAPVIIGFSSPLHLLIAGFALYEAWKLNRGVALRLTGPYQASRAMPS